MAWSPGLTAMGAIALWVRSILRRRRGATVALAVFAGLSAGVIGASFQAARRADGSVERHAARSRTYDLTIQGCPPEVGDPEALTSAELFALCLSNVAVQRLTNEVLAPMPEVESTTTIRPLLAGVLDESSKNGWGRGVIVLSTTSADPVGLPSRQILVDGRFADANAPDEMMIGERAARVGGIHVGDTIRLASWRLDSIDAATATGLAPQTAPIESRVVGIVRFATDVQSSAETDLTGATLPDGLFGGPAWAAAHAGDFATYGSAALVRLRNGPESADAFEQSLGEDSRGWTVQTDTFSEEDLPALQRVVETERQAVLIFAIIALVAGMVFVGLTLARQLRRELGDTNTLSALGLTRQGLITGAIGRALVAGVLAAAIAVVTVVAASELGPVGIARHLEYSHPMRFDWRVLAVVALAVPMFFAAIAAFTVIPSDRSDRRSVRTAAPGLAVPLGPVPRVALNFTRGGSPRLAVGVGAVAAAGAVAAGILIASFDRVIDHPARYGAWWDVVVGQYSDPGELQAGVDRLAANPVVADAAGFLDHSNAAVLDGVTVPYIAIDPVVGRPPTVIATGRAPAAADEVALGVATARRLHKGIGDTITVTSSEQLAFSETVHVTGIAVLNNPVASASNAGDGVLIEPDLAQRLVADRQLAQALVIRFDPSADRQFAIDSVVRDFGGSTRLATPPSDLGNLDRLRFVPWLIAALVGILGLASLVHALVTLLQRHAADLAVLAALGLTKRQRRRVGLAVGVALVAASIAIGLPAGLVLGRWVWRVVGQRIFIPSGPVMPWAPTVVAPLVALIVAIGVATLAARWVTRHTPAAQLRAE